MNNGEYFAFPLIHSIFDYTNNSVFYVPFSSSFIGIGSCIKFGQET
ncbi:hypothetical protein [Pleurocapsa sp. FMAR1]|nr:hypothetical protein [Pleurocapsa sp. FMAR1]